MRTFAEYFDRAQALLNAGFTTKTARKDALDYINRAFDIVTHDIRDRLLKARDAGEDDTTKAWRDAYYGTPACHVWKEKHAKQYARFPDLVKLANECAALRATVTAAPLVAKQPSARQVQAAKDAAKAMHCQICGRPIFADLGTIAHHGYERPGTGWQTASCFGAKRLPYEASRDALEQLIPAAHDRVARLVKAREDVKAERSPVSRIGERAREGRYGERSTYIVHFTRETLPYALYFARSAFPSHTGSVQPDGTLFDYGKAKTVDAFDYFKAQDVAERAHEIKNARDWVAYLEKRRDEWPGVTHAFQGRDNGWAKT